MRIIGSQKYCVVCRHVMCNWLSQKESMARIALWIVCVLVFVDTTLSMVPTLSDAPNVHHAEASWVSVAGGIGFLKGPGVALGSDIALQRHDLVIGLRFVYYHVVGVYQHPTDVGSPPNPKDYYSEVATLIGGNVNDSQSGHTSLSFGPCFSLGSFQDPGRHFEQVPFSRIGFTFDISHQFSDPSVSGMGGPGLRLFYSHNSVSSFLSLQFMVRFGNITTSPQ